MMLLTNQQLEQVATWLHQQGMSHEELEAELLDHLCTSIEHQMEEGVCFEKAFELSVGGFGDKGVIDVEVQTIHLLTYHSRLMKFITMAAGMLTISFLLITFTGFSQSVPSLSPLDGDIVVTSPFGMRTHPRTKKRQMHQGVDFRAETGTEVQATADGTVMIAGVDPEREAYGIMVLIEHADGYQTMYAHLSEADVEVGAHVRQGDLIGKVGSTGLSFGPHLHYEVNLNGQRVNPQEYFPQ